VTVFFGPQRSREVQPRQPESTARIARAGGNTCRVERNRPEGPKPISALTSECSDAVPTARRVPVPRIPR